MFGVKYKIKVLLRLIFKSGHLYMCKIKSCKYQLWSPLYGGWLPPEYHFPAVELLCIWETRQNEQTQQSEKEYIKGFQPSFQYYQKHVWRHESLPWGLLSLCCSLLPGIQWGRVEPNSQAAPHTSNVQQIPRIVSYLAVFFFNFYAWDILYGCFLFQSRAELECCEELDSQMDNGRVLVDAHM